MKTFKNTKFTKRNYECTNIVACQAETRPAEDYWAEADESILNGLTDLVTETRNGVRIKYWGYL